MRRILAAGTVRLFFALTNLALVLGAPALAATHERPAGRFDGKIRQLDGDSPVVVPQALDSFDPSDGLRAGWEEFGERHGGTWQAFLDERTAMPTLAYGRGIH